MRFRWEFALLAAFALLFSGCRGAETYELAPVSGVVTLGGEPLRNGVVNFQPIGGDNANPGPGSTGITDQQGRFELKTPDDAPGAVVGEHKVRIFSRNAEAPRQDWEPNPEPERVPRKYNYQSQLTFTVPPEGTETADFKLDTE
jgi:hypothetical protein